MTLFDIDCAESCHLESDHRTAMVLGAVVHRNEREQLSGVNLHV
ncbi:MAG TPA: hypothetical protein VGT98_09355 [Candidatus Elarobacter sp.]|nr:hypothetical protein [Candidatus Elarobacter sp.]HEV2738971.1 hypothetical protein [Candidatus Elarobacter sp.]